MKKNKHRPKWSRLNDKQKAHKLRVRAPKGEWAISDRMTGKGILGWSFRWNERVGNYFPDFTCEPLGLIIEIDGNSHIGKEAQDAKRQAELEAMGYEVQRIKSNVPPDVKLSLITDIVRNRLVALGIAPTLEFHEAQAAHRKHIESLAD